MRIFSFILLCSTSFGAAEYGLEEFKHTIAEQQTLEDRKAQFETLTDVQQRGVKLQLSHKIRNYNRWNNFFYGTAAQQVQQLHEAGYGEVLEVLVVSGDPFFMMLQAGAEFQRYSRTKDERALDEATRLYQQTIEQLYSYTGAYLLKVLGGIEDGWAARYMEWWADTDPDVDPCGEYWAIQYRLKPKYYTEKEVFFRYLKTGILKLHAAIKTIKESSERAIAAIGEREKNEIRKPLEKRKDEEQQAFEALIVTSYAQIKKKLNQLAEVDRLNEMLLTRQKSLQKYHAKNREDLYTNLQAMRLNNHPVGRAYLDLAIAEGIIPAEERDQYRIREEDPIVVEEAPGDRKRPRDDDASGTGAAE
ncbi:MAG: hypothetical protein Q8Q56_03065 [Alphaproteobacteria bacterium]|nr:hypothetical protein [Alphaproteobacteria bacterium]